MTPQLFGGRTMKFTKEKTLTIVTYAIAAMFLMSGGMKFMAPPEMVENFARWGFAQWFIYVVGAVEVGAAVLLAHLPRSNAPDWPHRRSLCQPNSSGLQTPDHHRQISVRETPTPIRARPGGRAIPDYAPVQSLTHLLIA